MKSSTESLSPTRVKLTIEVPFEEFEPNLKTAYKTIASQITIPGFRKGKIPNAIVDQRIGRPAVLDEAINSALPGWYSQALQDTKIQPLSQPDIDLTKFNDGEPIEITAELDVRPELDLPDVSKIAVTVADAEVTPDDVEEQIEELRKRFATFAEVDRAAADGDFVTIDLSAAQNGEPIEAAQAESMPYTIGSATMLDGLNEAIIGMKAGESNTFSTQLAGGELAGQDADVTVVLKDVKEQQLPDLDDDFAQTASQFDSLEELRADLTDRVTRGKRMEQANEARDLILDEIVSKIDAPLPENLVTEELDSRRAQIEQQLEYAGIPFETFLADEEQTKEEFEADLEKRVREALIAQFVLDQVVATEEFGIDDAELSAHIMRRAQQSGEEPSAYIQHIMEHNHVPEMVSEVLRGKALASLVESAQVTDKSGNAIELSRLMADGTYSDEEPEADETPAKKAPAKKAAAKKAPAKKAAKKAAPK
ncbi:trigger factor [Aeromicrobium panaciterrae]|uniref:trigger factor n=1 Tax=Aeromicrobium panaciterrae TaxID=363861 RepID=UPI0031DAA10B